MMVIPIDSEIQRCLCPGCQGPRELFTADDDEKCIRCRAAEIRFRTINKFLIFFLNFAICLMCICLMPIIAFIRAIHGSEEAFKQIAKSQNNITIMAVIFITMCIPMTIGLMIWEVLMLPALLAINWFMNWDQGKSIQIVELVI